MSKRIRILIIIVVFALMLVLGGNVKKHDDRPRTGQASQAYLLILPN